MAQEEQFVKGEADAWFERNREAMKVRDSSTSDPILRAMENYDIAPERALEIGASNGYRMHALHVWRGCKVAAIEPSAKAVEDGRKSFPEVDFSIGTACPLPYGNAEFDCVIVCGVFCWVDRSKILQAVSEADRVLADGGHLIIGDFSPLHPQRVLYHHQPDAGIYTYKMNYADIFLASRIYTLLSAQVFDHAGFRPSTEVAPHDRFSVTILKKQFVAGFLTKARPDAE